ncbi:hypothetical protein D3C73_1319570 [compost metagenome]
MNLIMQTDFLIYFVLIAIELHSIHTQVGIHNSWLFRVLGIDLRQRNKCPPVIRPMMNKRKIGYLDLLSGNGELPHFFKWKSFHGSKTCTDISERLLDRTHGIITYCHYILNRIPGFAEYEFTALHGSEQIGCCTEFGTFNSLK